VRSPAFWPYALGSAISITSKYVLRVRGRHLWNPTNFGVVAMLVLAADSVAGLSIQWGNNLLPVVVVWILGTAILHKVGRLHAMYQLFMFFMITDPKTTVGTKRGRIVVTVLIALLEAVFRLLRFVYAPFYALFIVGSIANLIEIVRAGKPDPGRSAARLVFESPLAPPHGRRRG
jgi:Na+-transporting NADH:ubiquinone oxidoreductase subunit NqrB